MPKMKKTADQIERENKLKNVAMNIIIKNREIKKRPKLADFLKVYRELMESEPDMTKEEFQEKMRLFFTGAPIDLHKVDERYNALAVKF